MNLFNRLRKINNHSFFISDIEDIIQVDIVKNKEKDENKEEIKSTNINKKTEQMNTCPSIKILPKKLVDRIRVYITFQRKRDFLQLLYENRNILLRIPLPISNDVDTIQAFRDAIRDDIVLNGIHFTGMDRTEAFIASIKRIALKYGFNGIDHLGMTDRVLRSCSRTSSGSDAYFVLKWLIDEPSILIKLRNGIQPPIDIKLGRDSTDKHLKCRIRSENLFGLYKHNDIDAMIFSNETTLEPWICIDTIMIEFIDLVTKKSLRFLSISSPEYVQNINPEIQELF